MMETVLGRCGQRVVLVVCVTLVCTSLGGCVSFLQRLRSDADTLSEGERTPPFIGRSGAGEMGGYALPGLAAIGPCASGFVDDKLVGRCVAVPPPGTCPEGLSQDGRTGRCMGRPAHGDIIAGPCPSGFDEDKPTGRCIAVSEPRAGTCPDGFTVDTGTERCTATPVAPYPSAKDLRDREPSAVNLDTLVLPGLEPPVETATEVAEATDALKKATAAREQAKNKEKVAQGAAESAHKKKEAKDKAYDDAQKLASAPPNLASLKNAAAKADDAATVADANLDKAKQATLDANAAADAAREAENEAERRQQYIAAHGSYWTAYEIASVDPSARDRLQDYLIARSDEICTVHESEIIGIASTVNTGLSAITSTVGAIGAVVSGTAATHALSGIAGLSNGLREDINENIYYSNFADAIVKKIESLRTADLAAITASRTNGVDAYSVDTAIRDVAKYHLHCSFYQGLQALASEDKRPPTADEIIGKLTTLRSQLQENQSAMSGLDAKQQQQLKNANAILANEIQFLTAELGAVDRAPSAGATTTTGTTSATPTK